MDCDIHLYEYKPSIAVDFDGVIMAEGHYPNFSGSLIKKNRDLIIEKKNAGYQVIIHTCRMTDAPYNDTEIQRQGIVNYLNLHEVPFDSIWNGVGKPIADEYWDDRAVRI